MQSETVEVVKEVVELFSIPYTPYRLSNIIAKDELLQLDDFLKLIIPVLRSDTSFADRLRGCAEHIARYVLRDSAPVAGSTYGALRHLVRRLGDCGLFDTVCRPPFFGNLDKEMNLPNENVIESSQKRSEQPSYPPSGDTCRLQKEIDRHHSDAVKDVCDPTRLLSMGKQTVRLASKKCIFALCPRRFSTAQTLRRHVILQHVASKFFPVVRLSCFSYSRKRFDRLQRCFVCLHCFKAFGSRNSVQAHQAFCTRLMSAFNNRAKSKAPEKIGVDEKLSEYELVQSSSLSERVLERRLRRETECDSYRTSKRNSSQKVRTFRICLKRFTSFSRASRLSRPHSARKSFAGKAFFNKNNYRRHVPVIHWPSISGYNDVSFSDSCLKRHMTGARRRPRSLGGTRRHVRCSSLLNADDVLSRDSATLGVEGNTQSEIRVNCADNIQTPELSVVKSSAIDINFVRCKHAIRRKSKRDSGVPNEAKKDSPGGDLMNEDTDTVQKVSEVASATTTKHRCPECGKCLATKSNLERHYRLHVGDRPFECEKCGSEFSDVSNLRKHELVHRAKKSENDSRSASEGSGWMVGECISDGNAATHADSRSSSSNSEHSVQENSDSVELGRKTKGHLAEFPCFVCGKVFLYRSHLYEHIKVHTNDRPYQCEVCGKAFKRTGDLTTHARFHDAEKQFECADCGQRFRWKNGLDRHRRIHTGERPFLCTVCGRAFADWGSHKQHVRSHLMLGAGVQPERFPCKVCGKTFAWKRGLARHGRSHAAGKPGAGF